jgi:hypothetical protein
LKKLVLPFSLAGWPASLGSARKGLKDFEFRSEKVRARMRASLPSGTQLEDVSPSRRAGAEIRR